MGERDVFGSGPQRAHTIVISAGSDTATDLAWELRHLADRIQRGELTHGCIGGGSSGCMYSYRANPEQTHDRYFQEIDAWLATKESQT